MDRARDLILVTSHNDRLSNLPRVQKRERRQGLRASRTHKLVEVVAVLKDGRIRRCRLSLSSAERREGP
jgi:hypothetical protein